VRVAGPDRVHSTRSAGIAETAPAWPGERPGARAATAPRLGVLLSRPTDIGHICRVDAPDRVLRIWALLNIADDELHQVKLPPAAAARLQRQFDAVTAELERSVSPALACELHRLIGHKQAAAPTADELRVEYAGPLGWTGSLVIGMLSQIEAAARRRPATPPGVSAGGGPSDAAARAAVAAR